MRLQVISDLHLEWQRDGGASLLAEVLNDGADVLLLAGDVVSLERGVEPLTERQLRTPCERFPRVYYVPGNHDFYRLSPDAGMARLGRIADRIGNLVILDTGRIDTYKGHRFLGATMWFPDMPGNEKYDGRIATAGMMDFFLIRGFVPWVYEQHAAFTAFLTEHLREGDIVLTHHLPSVGSVHRDFAGSELNRFFVGDQESLIRERAPALWVHGHTHRSCDYRIGPTRVLCNPFGYPNELNRDFRARLTVTLPDA